MRRNRKGFTIVELVITIAILGISTALTAVVISTANQAQQASAAQYAYNNIVNGIDSMVRDFVSFVSVNDEESSFTYYSCTSNKVTFKHNTYEYYLSYSNNTFTFSTDYDGEDDYFKKNSNLEVQNVTNVSFNYFTDTSLLSLSLKVDGIENHFNYVVRTLL